MHTSEELLRITPEVIGINISQLIDLMSTSLSILFFRVHVATENNLFFLINILYYTILQLNFLFTWIFPLEFLMSSSAHSRIKWMPFCSVIRPTKPKRQNELSSTLKLKYFYWMASFAFKWSSLVGRSLIILSLSVILRPFGKENAFG